jgi:hypothetical protein
MHVGLPDPSFSYKTLFISDVNFPGRKCVSPSPAIYLEQPGLFLGGEASKTEKRILSLLSFLVISFFSLPSLLFPLPLIQFSNPPLTSFLNLLFFSFLLYSSSRIAKGSQMWFSLLATCNEVMETVRHDEAIRYYWELSLIRDAMSL